MKPAAWKQLAGLSAQGLSAETLAGSVAVGLVIGVFPAFGIPTVLCAAAAAALRLNPAAVQLVNCLSSPLQLALLVPFFRLGERLFRGPAAAGGAAPAHLSAAFCGAAWHTVAAWFCVSAPLGLLLYFVLRILLRRGRTGMVQWKGMPPLNACKAYGARSVF